MICLIPPCAAMQRGACCPPFVLPQIFCGAQAVQAYAQRCANGGHAAEGYTIKQIMEVLPLSYAFLIELIHSGKLRAYKCGRRYIIPQDALEEFLAASRLDKADEHTEQLLQEEQGEESEQ